MKKFLLLSTLIGLTTTANAGHGNVYVGPFVGMGNTISKFTTTEPTGFTMRSHRIGTNSFLGGLVLGYAYPCNRWFAGFEILGNLDTTKDTIVRENTSSATPDTYESFKFTKRASYGFAARFGYRTQSDVVTYVRLGGEWANHKLTYRLQRITSASYSSHKTKFAFVPGLGIEAPIGGKWRARIEAKYSLAQKINLTLPLDTVNSPNYSDTRNRLRTGQTSVVLGVTYSF